MLGVGAGPLSKGPSSDHTTGGLWLAVSLAEPLTGGSAGLAPAPPGAAQGPPPTCVTAGGLHYGYPGAGPGSPAWQLRPSFLAASTPLQHSDGQPAAVAGGARAPRAAPAGASEAALPLMQLDALLASLPPATASLASPPPALLLSAPQAQLAAWLRVAGGVMAALALVEPEAFLGEVSRNLAGEHPVPGGRRARGACNCSPACGACQQPVHRLAYTTICWPVIPCTGAAPDTSVCHPMMLAAISRALRAPSGAVALRPQLGFVAALAVQALDPARPALRHSAGAAAGTLLRDMAARFPQVDLHAATQQLAVGAARALAPGGIRAATPSGGGSGSGGGDSHVSAMPTAPAAAEHARAVAVFDVSGGTRRIVLVLPASSILLPTGGGSGGGAVDGGLEASSGIDGELRGLRSSGTMQRAEAAMLQHWFGLQPAAGAASGGAPGAAAALAAAPPGLMPAGRPPPRRSVGGGSGAAAGGLPAAYYPSAAAAEAPVLSAADLTDGVAAVALSPSGSACAALLAGAGAAVVWRLQTSWTERLGLFGGGRAPTAHLPYCYLPLPPTSLPFAAEFSAGQGPGSWRLVWDDEATLVVQHSGRPAARLLVTGLA